MNFAPDLYPIAEPQTWCEFECEVPYSSSNRLSQIVAHQPTTYELQTDRTRYSKVFNSEKILIVQILDALRC